MASYIKYGSKQSSHDSHDTFNGSSEGGGLPNVVVEAG